MARMFSHDDRLSGLTLVVKPVDDPEKPVDAEQFLQAATKWLSSLTSFASSSGLDVRWEIAELRESSAVLEVIPVEVRTGIIATSIAKGWKQVVKEIEDTGRAPNTVRPDTVREIEQFISAGNHFTMTIRAGADKEPQNITVMTQKRAKEAVASLPSEEFSQEGTVRGNLVVLNSWNKDERWFRLRIPIAPDRQVRCAYKDEALIEELGDTFEKLIDVTGLMHYRKEDIWPHLIEVQSVKRLEPVSLDSFLSQMKPFDIPVGMDSVSYIRSIRDGE